MEGPKEIWEDIEETREKLRLKRRQITGGDIEDEIVLKGKSVVHLADEAFEHMEDSIGGILFGIQDGLYTKKDREFDEKISGELRDLVSVVKEKRRMITYEKVEDKLEDIWDDIEEKFEGIFKWKDD